MNWGGSFEGREGNNGIRFNDTAISVMFASHPCHLMLLFRVDFYVVGVAQSVEHLVVAQVVGGSSPLAHPISPSSFLLPKGTHPLTEK